jgi:8-oxo-dGTP pyrophosphatase MutT (NUDIX family)
MSDSPVVRVDRLELSVIPRPWPFALARRAEINEHFEKQRQVRPALFNGRVLLLHDHAIAGNAFRGHFFESDFASFLAWRDWGFPDAAVKNCFAMGALRGSDGSYLLGVMGGHTANAGKIYFPSGTPEPADVAGARLDLDSNVAREVAEETGLRPEDVEAQAGWYTVSAGPRIALMKVLQARESATALRARILAYLAGQRQPELAGIRIVRGRADIEVMMPPFVTAFLSHMWRCFAP